MALNPVQVVEAARPDVGPLPALERRQLRERLFDVAMRSQTNHAPIEVQSPGTRRANAVRLAGLALLGATAIGGLLYSASRDTPGATPTDPSDSAVSDGEGRPPTRVTVAPAPRPTTAPTTTTPPVPGSAETPLLLPPERNRLDALRVERARLGGSALLLRAPDLSTISLFEADGVPAADPEPVDPDAPPETDDAGVPVTTLPPRPIGGLTVIPPDEESPTRYDVEVPCGEFVVLDVAGRAPFRPEVTQLFESMRLDGGQIQIALPDGWTAISGGSSTDEFLFGLPVEIDDRDVTIELAQYPGGSLALAGFDDRLYAPATFAGRQSWIHRSVEDPDAFDLLTMVGTTAVRVSTREISLPELESVLDGLTPGDVDDWVRRFGELPTIVDPDIRTCPQQPEFELG